VSGPAGGPRSLLGRDLKLRVASAAVLAPVGLFAAWAGGVLWLALTTLGALLLLWEWNGLTRSRSVDALFAGGVAITLALAAALGFGFARGVLALFGALVLAASVLAMMPHRTVGRTVWMIRGLAYALALLVPLVVLRGSASHGLTAVLFLFAVVWTTDVAAYFAGRAIGGPKLWPAISPKKTWAGLVGGTLGAALAGAAAAWVAGLPHALELGGLAIFLSLVAHAGDLFESWVKRSFAQKDSGKLIPGHGGAMDRLDGFIFAATAALALGLVRGGVANPAAGLLLW
jgi:phosphatidate cytidylyltransferase